MPTRETRAPAVAALLALLLSGCGVRQMMYPAPPVAVPSPPPPPFEEVVLDTGEEQAVAWHFAAPDLAPGRPAVVFFHGNGENLQTMWYSGILADLGNLGIAGLAVDYPGYGRSTGSPSEPSIFRAANAALDWLERRHSDRPLVAAGWSLGAAAAIHLAADHPDRVDGLIALAPFTSAEDVGAAHFPRWLVRLLLRDRLDSLSVCSRVACPTLVAQGTADRIIPVAHGRAVAGAIPQARWLELPGVGHNDLFQPRVVWGEMRLLLDQLSESGG